MRALVRLGSIALCSANLAACAGPSPAAKPLCDDRPPTVQDRVEPGGIRPFTSDAELANYLYPPEPKPAPRTDCIEVPKGSAAGGGAGGAPVPPANDGITYNQEVGVDEGGIVKNIGDSLVILRKGQLFAVRAAEGEAPALTDSMRVAHLERFNGATAAARTPSTRRA